LLKVFDEVCQKSIGVMMTMQDAGALDSHPIAEPQQGNQPRQEAATSARLDE